MTKPETKRKSRSDKTNNKTGNLLIKRLQKKTLQTGGVFVNTTQFNESQDLFQFLSFYSMEPTKIKCSFTSEPFSISLDNSYFYETSFLVNENKVLDDELFASITFRHAHGEGIELFEKDSQNQQLVYDAFHKSSALIPFLRDDHKAFVNGMIKRFSLLCVTKKNVFINHLVLSVSAENGDQDAFMPVLPYRDYEKIADVEIKVHQLIQIVYDILAYLYVLQNMKLHKKVLRDDIVQSFSTKTYHLLNYFDIKESDSSGKTDASDLKEQNKELINELKPKFIKSSPNGHICSLLNTLGTITYGEKPKNLSFEKHNMISLALQIINRISDGNIQLPQEQNVAMQSLVALLDSLCLVKNGVHSYEKVLGFKTYWETELKKIANEKAINKSVTSSGPMIIFDKQTGGTKKSKQPVKAKPTTRKVLKAKPKRIAKISSSNSK